MNRILLLLVLGLLASLSSTCFYEEPVVYDTDAALPVAVSVSINNGADNTTSTSVTLSLSATDDVGVTKYYASESSTTPSVSGSGWQSYSTSVAFAITDENSDGTYPKTVYVWFKDDSGKMSSSVNDSINYIKDTTAPTAVSVSIDSGADNTTSTAVTLTLSATDNIAVTDYYASESNSTPSANANGWASYATSASFTLSSASGAGTYPRTVYVWFKDGAGNLSNSVNDSINFVVNDVTPPTANSVVIDGGADNTTSTTVTLTLSATDDVGVTDYYASENATAPLANASGWAAYSDNVSYTFDNSTSETKTVYVWIKDTAGNMSASVNDLIVKSENYLSNISKISLGWDFTCALLIDGTTKCWGKNDKGQLGDGTSDNQISPSAVSTISTGQSIDSNREHSCLLKTDNTMSCWGKNDDGQIGDNSSINRNIPATVVNLNNVNDYDLGHSHSCALLGNGTVKCWGNNTYGMLGDGNLGGSFGFSVGYDSMIPVSVYGLTNITMISSNCAVNNNNDIMCWGFNGNGELGDNTTLNRSTPVFSNNLGSLIEIDYSYNHTCALTSNNIVYCWGLNDKGQLGYSTSDSCGGLACSKSANQVNGLNNVTQISVGRYHTCALISDKTVKCWGLNDKGQLGDNSTQNRNTPTEVYGVNNASYIFAGSDHTCAVLSDRIAKCWGNNTNGELGNGEIGGYKIIPTVVLN